MVVAVESETWMEPLVEQWDTPLALELQPAAEEWSSEWLLPEHELSSAPVTQGLFPQESENPSSPGIEEDYWKEPDLPW